ncbi:hypothetical protein Y032_0014g2262 [Ancylostoma ceylanicum]|uniref:Uncharacterized protein n=1 Tax=Ancylostoma ceylanicum TaxID=53326 RepID=A0A016V8M2_9BILA|nr:hypothetical protein Y032_0014g2262 [Ancylostoma ceylanicum]
MVAGGAPSSTRPTELRRDHFREQLQATPPYLLQSPYLDNRAEFGDLRNVFFDSLGWFCTCSHCQLVDIPCLKWCKQLLLCWVCHHAMHLKLFWEGFSLYCQFIGLFDAVYPEGVANALNADISCRRCGLYCEHMGKHCNGCVQDGCHELRPFDCMYDCKDIFNDEYDVANLGCNALSATPAPHRDSEDIRVDGHRTWKTAYLNFRAALCGWRTIQNWLTRTHCSST